MKKKIVSALLVSAMAVGLFSGCGGGGNSGDTQGNGNGGGNGGDSGETYTVIMGYIGNTYNDEAMIEEKINEIIEPELNARIDLRPFAWGTYTQELQLILSGNEELDLVPIIVSNAASYVNNGQVIDLSGMIEQYGTNIKKYVDADFLSCPRIGDTTYGVTTMREQITDEGIMMRRDIVEELGYAVNEDGLVEEIKSLDDLTALYEKVKAAYPNMIMCGSGANGTPLFRWETTDMLTDGFGGLMDFGQSTEFVNIYESDEFRAFADLMYAWNQAGYFSSDAMTTTEPPTSQVKAGNTFSYFTPYKAGAIEQDELSSGYDLCFAELFGDPYITSYSINFFTWGIARNSKNPEKAFQVLDYIYGSTDVMNLLNWGVEGVHYQVLNAENNEIGYAEGVDADNTGWCLNIGWELPNQEISYVWTGESSAKWDLQKELIERARRSKALGFSYDASTVSTQLTALTNVKNQYFDAIGTGNGDPAKLIQEFNDALYAAGLQDVIDEKQKQLDAWLVENQ